MHILLRSVPLGTEQRLAQRIVLVVPESHLIHHTSGKVLASAMIIVVDSKHFYRMEL